MCLRRYDQSGRIPPEKNAQLRVLALVAYEHVITLHAEYALVLGHKWTGSTLLFMLNRYVLLSAVTYDVLPYSATVSAISYLFSKYAPLLIEYFPGVSSL